MKKLTLSYLVVKIMQKDYYCIDLSKKLLDMNFFADSKVHTDTLN